jgi:hypothetical protein
MPCLPSRRIIKVLARIGRRLEYEDDFPLVRNVGIPKAQIFRLGKPVLYVRHDSAALAGAIQSMKCAPYWPGRAFDIKSAELIL